MQKAIGENFFQGQFFTHQSLNFQMSFANLNFVVKCNGKVGLTAKCDNPASLT